MMIRTFIVSSLALLCVLRPGMSTPPVDDLQRMEGSWKAKYAEKANKAVPSEELAATQVRVTGPILSILINGRVVNNATLSLDSAKEPKQLKLQSPDGQHAALGIYKFESDELRLCWDNRPGKRPAAFSGMNDSGSLVYFRLVKATP